jgi:hypothetical protein
MSRSPHPYRHSCARRPHAATALLALMLALSIPPVALADLAPPTAAPTLAKRICTRYRVVETPSGPLARCTAHATHALRAPKPHPGRHAAGSSRAPHRAGSAPSGGGAPTGGSAQQTSPGAPARLSDRASGSAAHASSGGASASAIVAIALAGTLAATALLALMRSALARRRKGGAHAAAS